MSKKRDGRLWTAGLDGAFAGRGTGNLAAQKLLPTSPTVKVAPNLWILKIGGQSIMDRGRSAVFPIIEELVKANEEGIQFIVGVGGGTRARHAYALGLDIGMPTGSLARLGARIPLQNARMLQILMAQYNGMMIYHDHEDLEKLPLYLAAKCIPIMSAMPPFGFWEKTPAVGRLPENRSDAGVYLLAEFLGAKGMIFIKDEDGLYTADPKKDPDATFIAEADAKDLLDSGQDDLIVERVILGYMLRAKNVREIRIINGLKPGQVLAALRGEAIGTTIRAGR